MVGGGVFVRAPQYLDGTERKAHRLGVVGAEHQPSGDRWSRPPLTGAVGPPLALHLEVGVHADLIGSDEQMFAIAGDTLDPLSDQIDGGIARYSEIAAGQRLSVQREPQSGGGEENGIAFRHGSTIGRS